MLRFSVSSTCPNSCTPTHSSGAGMPCTFAPECFHGTHVAGIAAGNGAELLRRRARCEPDGDSRFHLSTTVWQSCAPAYRPWMLSTVSSVSTSCRRRSIAAANMSLGGEAFSESCDPQDPCMTAAIAQPQIFGVATIVSSGNDGFLNATLVSGLHLERDQRRAQQATAREAPADLVMPFSNSASFLSLLAPGLPHHFVGSWRWIRQHTGHVDGRAACGGCLGDREAGESNSICERHPIGDREHWEADLRSR